MRKIKFRADCHLARRYTPISRSGERRGLPDRADFGYIKNDAWGAAPSYEMRSSSSIPRHDERQPS